MKKFLTAGAIVALLLVLPLISKRTDVLDLVLLFFLFSTLAQSWNILGGYTGQVSLGHAAFFGMGALVTRLLWEAGIPFALAFIPGGIAALILSAIIGLPALRLKGIYFAIGTLGLAMISRIMVGNILPTVSFMPAKQLATYSLVPRYYVGLLLAVIINLVVFFLMNSKKGLGMLTVREDEEAAAAVGIDVFRHKVLALALSSFFAGLAGSMYAYYYASYYYYVPFELGWCFDPLLIAFIGGVGTLTGPIIGTIIFVVLREVFTLTLGEAHIIIFGVIFILIVFILPGGLIEAAGRGRRFLSVLLSKRMDSSSRKTID